MLLSRLCILTPTASDKLLDGFSAKLELSYWLPGVDSLGQSLRSAIVAIHQLPPTPETLWLRILGKGTVQQRAIDELEALPFDSPFRANALKLLLNFRVILEAKQNISQDDQELIMRLAPLFDQKLAEATQKGIEQGLEQGQELHKQELADATKQGERQVVETLLKTRFGEIDEPLSAIITPLLALAPEEFTPLLLNLSKDELIDRFSL